MTERSGEQAFVSPWYLPALSKSFVRDNGPKSKRVAEGRGWWTPHYGRELEEMHISEGDYESVLL